MNTTAIGRAAEAVAAEYLQNLGYQLIDQNWRTRWCEIDLIVGKVSTIYFVEVKYRRSNAWGSGLDYITPKKLQQMHFAAEFWTAKHKSRADYCLSALSLAGDPPTPLEFIKSI